MESRGKRVTVRQKGEGVSALGYSRRQSGKAEDGKKKTPGEKPAQAYTLGATAAFARGLRRGNAGRGSWGERMYKRGRGKKRSHRCTSPMGRKKNESGTRLCKALAQGKRRKGTRGSTNRGDGRLKASSVGKRVHVLFGRVQKKMGKKKSRGSAKEAA